VKSPPTNAIEFDSPKIHHVRRYFYGSAHRHARELTKIGKVALTPVAVALDAGILVSSPLWGLLLMELRSGMKDSVL